RASWRSDWACSWCDHFFEGGAAHVVRAARGARNMEDSRAGRGERARDRGAERGGVGGVALGGEAEGGRDRDGVEAGRGREEAGERVGRGRARDREAAE